MNTAEQVFARKYNELQFLIASGAPYDALKISAILRHFLVDETPLVDLVNRGYRNKIRYPVQPDLQIVFEDGSQLKYISTKGYKFFKRGGLGILEIKKSELLALKMIDSPLGQFSVLEVIKYAANEAGAVHFGKLKGSKAISQVDRIVIETAMYEIGKIVLLGLDGLKTSIAKIPEGLPLLAHYKMPPGRFVMFHGHKESLATRSMNTEIGGSFIIMLELALLTQPRSGNRVIYQLGGVTNAFCYTLELTSDKYLSSSIKVNSSKSISIVYPNYKHFVDRWVSIVSEVEFEENSASITLLIDGHTIGTSVVNFRRRNSKVTAHTIGSDLTGKRCAAFNVAEIILVKDRLSEIQKNQLYGYFEAKWKR